MLRVVFRDNFLRWLYLTDLPWICYKRELARLSRDETLSRLPLRLGGMNVVELNQLRETSRPVWILREPAAAAAPTRRLSPKIRRVFRDNFRLTQSIVDTVTVWFLHGVTSTRGGEVRSKHFKYK